LTSPKPVEARQNAIGDSQQTCASQCKEVSAIGPGYRNDVNTIVTFGECEFSTHPDIVATLSAQIDEQLAIHGNATGE
jgi:hypothetical protein